MKIFIFGISLLVVSLTTAWAEEPFAIVELFASEGCSSCPPADDLLRRLIQEKGKRIYALSFEVDYWDYLGWKDPFSRPEFTQRQHRYAEVFRNSSVYTPQMIINGQNAFVGSDEAQARKHINHFLKVPSALSIDLKVELDQKDVLKVKYQLDVLPKGAVINFALVQHMAEIPVKSGENAGRTLIHGNVVLDFKTIELNASQGELVFTSTSQMSMLNIVSVIAYIQDRQNMKILGAQVVDLENNI